LKKLLLFSISVVFFACKDNKNPKKLDTWIGSQVKANNLSDTPFIYSLKKMSVISFLDKLTSVDTVDNEFNFITINDQSISKDWINSKDIDTLITLVKSKKKCKCVVNVLSSYLPISKSAELGGYVLFLLTHYKEGKDINFGLSNCPMTNENEADELIKWWRQTKR
jgi:hypothetical protein